MNGADRSLEHLNALDELYHTELAALRARAVDAHTAIAEGGMRLTELATPPAMSEPLAGYDTPTDAWSVDDLPLGGFQEDSPPRAASAPPPIEADAFATDDDGIPIWQD